jgi:hypothetical protein
MAENGDRFGDLGGPPRRSAAERFEEEDRLRPEPDAPERRPPVPRPGNRYAWLVGILLLMGISVVYLTTAQHNQGAAIRGPHPGELLPAFAAPLTTGNFSDDADSNVFPSRAAARSSGRRQGACDVVAPSVLNSCQLRRYPTVLTFIVTKGTDCEPQVDRVERMRKAFPKVHFAVLMSGNKISDAKKIAENRGWTLPVGVDKDGQVENLFGNGVCPTTVFSYPGGRVRVTKLGNLTEDQLRAGARAILRPR